MVHAQFRSMGEEMRNTGLQEVKPRIVKDLRIAAQRPSAVSENAVEHSNPGFERPLRQFGVSPSKRLRRWVRRAGESGSPMPVVPRQ